jgi:PAS domain S-box-containing protein
MRDSIMLKKNSSLQNEKGTTSDDSIIIDKKLSAHFIISKTDLTGKITHACDQFCKISGYQREELLGRDHRIVNSGHHSKEFFQEIWNTIKNGEVWRGEIKNKAKSGDYYWVDSTISPLISESGDITGFISFRYDITERKLALEKLELSESKHKQLFHQAKDAIMTLAHPDWKFASCNEATLNLFNIESEKEFVKLGPWNVSPEFQPDGTSSAELANMYITKAVEDGSCFFEWSHCTSDGTEIPCTVLLSRIEDSDGVYLHALVRDISEQKKLERELIKSHDAKLKEFEEILSSTPSCLKIISKEGHLVNMNQRGLNLIEAESLDAVRGANVYDIVDQSHREKFKKFNERICAGHKETLVFEIIGLKGTRRWMETYAAPYQLANGEIGHVAITNEITERVHAEEEYRQQRAKAQHQSKLASLGELAAGVGHEINNPLAVIKGHVELLLADLHERKKDISYDRIEKYLKKVDFATDRISTIVKGLRTFSRIDKDENKQFDLVEATKDAFEMVREIFQVEDIDISFFVDDESRAALISGSQGKFQQICVNLLTNAKDALTHSKIKKIEVSIHQDDGFELRIKDSGGGIPEDVKERIFDPFFTTKEVNKGTGIGLSLVHSFVSELGGNISFESVKNEGTTFKIKFINLENKIEQECAQNEDSPLSVHQKRILIADDEEGIREILADILEDLEHEVHCASNGQEASDLYLKNPEHYDLIITDAKMPILDGFGLIRNIRSQNEIKQPVIILITGGVSVDLDAENSIYHKQLDGYLFKPFSRAQVKDVITTCFRKKKAA